MEFAFYKLFEPSTPSPAPHDQPRNEEEEDLLRRYTTDLNRLRGLRADASLVGEIRATLLVNFGPAGRVLPGVIPDSGQTPMQMLMDVLFALSVKAGLHPEVINLGTGKTGDLSSPTYTTHVVDVAPVVCFPNERLMEMGLMHICMLQDGTTRYKRCRYTTKELFEAALEQEKAKDTFR